MYYEYSAIVDAPQEDGTTKKVVDKLLIKDDVMMAALTKGEEYFNFDDSESVGIVKTKVSEVLGDRDGQKDVWLAKVQLITLDEATQKEKKQTVQYAVWADSVETATQAVKDTMNLTMMNYNIKAIQATKWEDVVE